MDPPSTYKSYLLRLWTATREGESVWRASLQNTATGQRQGFPDLESLFAYLEAAGEALEGGENGTGVEVQDIPGENQKGKEAN